MPAKKDLKTYKPKMKIAVSGAAETGHCSENALTNAELLGKHIAESGMVLVTGATNGVPYWAAKGAKEAGGEVIGFSPAASKMAHMKTYKLPLDYHDLIVYTGMDYSGRNLVLVRSADAVLVVCGRMGTLNEFTIAFEDDKPIGVLLESGGTADMIQGIVEKAHRGSGRIVYDSDPQKLLKKLVAVAEKAQKEL